MDQGGSGFVGHGAAGGVKAASGEEPVGAGVGAVRPQRDPVAAAAEGVVEDGVEQLAADTRSLPVWCTDTPVRCRSPGIGSPAPSLGRPTRLSAMPTTPAPSSATNSTALGPARPRLEVPRVLQ